MFDIVIIGAGVCGTAIARELSRYDASICVLEKEEDVCCGTSKANSAIIHAGYDALPGTLMAKFNVQGNQMMDELARELDIPFKRCGSLVVCTEKENLDGLQKLYNRGIKNGVEGLQILNKEEAHKMEPNLSEEVEGALYAPTAGIVCPFELTIAMAENANMNGVEFRFQVKVEQIEKAEEGTFVIQTNQGNIKTRCVVNAAGVYADEIHNMVSEKKLHIIPRRGDYLLLDKSAGNHVAKTIFALPTKKGKGILVSPTVHGNLLIGPTAVDLEDKEGTNTTAMGLSEASEKAALSVKNLPLRSVITSFAGLRAHGGLGDFVIGEVEDCEGFFDCACMESPGLSASPAVGKYLAEQIRDKYHLTENEYFCSMRRGIIHPSELAFEERVKLIQENPDYGMIICRCEMITEGEIKDAIHRPLGARSLDGVKRRTRAGMGRCQSGFCSPRVMEILSKELGVPMTAITKNGGNSRFLTGTKE